MTPGTVALDKGSKRFRIRFIIMKRRKKMKVKIGAVIVIFLGAILGLAVVSCQQGGKMKLKDGKTLEAKLDEINQKLGEIETLLKGGGRGRLQEGKEYKFNLEDAPVLGSKDAKVKVVIWSDFQCPFCERMGAMLEELVRANPNKFSLYFKNKVVHDGARLEHEAGLSAHAQGKFWELHDLFFQNRGEMVKASQEGEDKLKQKILELAAQAGVNVDKLKADLDSHKYSNKIDEEEKEASANQIMSTPSVFVNGYFYGYDPSVIREQILEADQKPSAGKETAKAEGIEGTLQEIDEKLDNLKKALEKKRPSQEQPQGPEMGKEFSFDLATAPVLGPKDAKVKVVIFSDFQCPYCERMSKILEEIQKANSGQVALFYKNFVVHESAILEHKAAMSAASQGKFWQYHDLLFQNRMDLFKLSQEGEDKLKEKLLELGKQAKLNTSQLKKDLESNTYESIIKNNIEEGRKVNVSGTPSVFINGYFYGYQPDVIKAKIEEEAKK